MNTRTHRHAERPASGTLAAARYFYRQLFWRRPYMPLALLLALFLVLAPFHLMAKLGCVFIFGGLPSLGVTLLPPHLPVSRRQLLLWSSLPAIAVLLIGVAASLAIGPRRLVPQLVVGAGSPPFVVVSAPSAAGRAPSIEFADELWRLGEPDPEGVQLPDGSRVQPERRAWVGGLLVAHNPFTVPADATLEQAALQVHRALAACCELRLSVAQVRAHLADGTPMSAESLAAAAVQRPRAGAAGQLLGSLAIIVLSLAWARAVVSSQPSAARTARRKAACANLPRVFAIGLVVAILLGFFTSVLVTAASRQMFFAPGSLGLLAGAAERHPGLSLALGSFVAFLLARSLVRRYERLELPLAQGTFGAPRC